MNTPTILYYALLEFDQTSKKIPKYVITQSAGCYPPMEQLKGKDGKVSFYLQESQKSGIQKASAPEMRFQGKGSLNVTGLKSIFDGGQLSGYAYGYPYDKPTYSSKKLANPFYEHKDDAFVFKVYNDDNALTAAERTRPAKFEMIIIDGGKILAASYGKQMQLGGFEEALQALRKQAQSLM